jgi:hypothetical protein
VGSLAHPCAYPSGDGEAASSFAPFLAHDGEAVGQRLATTTWGSLLHFSSSLSSSLGDSRDGCGAGGQRTGMETRATVVGLVEGGAATCMEGDGAAHKIKQLVEPVGTYMTTPSNHPSSTSSRDWKLHRCCSPHRH